MRSARHPEPNSSTSCVSDFERAERIGEFCGNPKTRSFADC